MFLALKCSLLLFLYKKQTLSDHSFGGWVALIEYYLLNFSSLLILRKSCFKAPKVMLNKYLYQSQFQNVGMALPEFHLFQLPLLRIWRENCFKGLKLTFAMWHSFNFYDLFCMYCKYTIEILFLFCFRCICKKHWPWAIFDSYVRRVTHFISSIQIVFFVSFRGKLFLRSKSHVRRLFWPLKCSFLLIFHKTSTLSDHCLRRCA